MYDDLAELDTKREQLFAKNLKVSERRDVDEEVEPHEDNVRMDNDTNEMARIMELVSQSDSELKERVMYNTVGMPKNMDEIVQVMQRILSAESDEEVIEICSMEGISMEEIKDDDEMELDEDNE